MILVYYVHKIVLPDAKRGHILAVLVIVLAFLIIVQQGRGLEVQPCRIQQPDYACLLVILETPELGMPPYSALEGFHVLYFISHSQSEVGVKIIS